MQVSDPKPALTKDEGKPLMKINKLDPKVATSSFYQDHCQLFCFPEIETKTLELIGKFVRKRNLTIVGMESKNVLSEINPGELEVEIKFTLISQSDRFNLSDSEEIIKLLKTEAKVNSISWQFSSM